MSEKPTGLVTFLFTEIAGSTKFAQRFADKMPEVLVRHNDILRHSIETNNGFIFKTIGDAYCSVFENTNDAVKAAVDAQIKLNSEKWGEDMIKIRMGIYRGMAEWNGSDYVGYVTLATVNRIMSSSNGGQILISFSSIDNSETLFPGGITFRDLGERKLKDLNHTVRIYQVISPDLPSDFPQLRTLDIRPNNIPVQLTSFIGREKELSEIKSMLHSLRFVTLIGPGGTGKTRLSCQLGTDVIDEFKNGVWIIELASIKDPSLIYNTIASVLNIREDGSRKLAEIIFTFLKEKEILLIFDNCEHLLGECAEIFQSLLNKCQLLKIVATSREVLRIPGENTYHVSTLSMPEMKNVMSADSVMQFEAIRLFVERATAVKKNFEINDDNASSVASLCRHLDGIPLAIELAAARVNVLSIEKILNNLSNRFKLLTGGSRTSLPRQQTLKALIDWSYDLLSEKEKKIFVCISVFSGGWSMEAACEVCSNADIEEYEVLDLISNLIDKSIVVIKEKNGVTRYDMLETIRQYSYEKLTSRYEISEKHFEYFRKLADNDADLNSDQDKKWEREMEGDHDNLRSAISWSLENVMERAASFVIKVAEYWETKGNFTESLDALKKFLDLDINTDSLLRATALVNAAYVASGTDEIENAENYMKKGLEYFRKTENTIKISEALSVYGIILFVKGDTENARKCCEEGLELIKDGNEKLLESHIKGNLAAYYSGAGNAEVSLKLLEEAIEIQRKFNNKRDLLGKMLISKGGVYYQNGDLEKARSCFEEGLIIVEEYNDEYSVATTLYNMGNLNFALKKYTESAAFYERAMIRAKEYGHMGAYYRSQIKLGEILLMQNENEKAKQIFVESLKSFDKHSEKLKLNLSIYGLAKYYFHEKKYERAAKLFLLTERFNEYINFKFSKSRLDENNAIMEELKGKIRVGVIEELSNEVMSFDLDKASEIALEISNEK
ncbi:MAG: tetratricopeptide repeat protein [Ignavibacteria bacterium]